MRLELDEAAIADVPEVPTQLVIPTLIVPTNIVTTAQENARESGKFQIASGGLSQTQLTDLTKPAITTTGSTTGNVVKKLTPREQALKWEADAQAAATKPELTDDQVKAGYTIKWVRTGLKGAGEWRVIKPVGKTSTIVTPSGDTPSGDTPKGDTPSGDTPKGDTYTTVDGVLMLNGKPFSGSYGGKTYENGKAVVTPGGGGDTYSIVDGMLMLNGKPFSGAYGGKTYNAGKEVTTPGNDTPAVTMISTVVDPATGQVTGWFSDGSSKVLAQGGLSQVETDAYALLEDTFRGYGLESLVPEIKTLMAKKIGPNQAALQLKQDPNGAYQKRFAGNKIRLAKGQNALSESEYLALEDSYVETLNSYGLSGYFGNTRDEQIAGMANIIGGDVSAREFADRVSTVVTQVKQGDPAIKAALKTYYNIDDADIVKYYLDPSKDNLAALKQKTLSAEIGAAGTAQGLTVQKTTAEALAAQGVTQAQAQQGYKTVGEILPTSLKLSDIYGEKGIKYGQTEAEAEVFGTTGAASAQRKRKQLQQLEEAAFSGQGGINPQYSGIGRSIQGQF